MLAATWLVSALPAIAHPLGNDSITHFNVLYVLPDRLEVDFLLDLAENPSAYVEAEEMDTDGDGNVSREEQDAWLAAKVDDFARLLIARVGDTDLTLSQVPEKVDPDTGRKLTTSRIIVPMLGPMGMTYRLVIRYVGEYPESLGAGEHLITYEDKTWPRHIGLKLVLLEPPPPLCRIFDIDFETLDPGPVPESVATALADEALPLSDPQAALIEPVSPSARGQRRWRVIDGQDEFVLIAQEGSLDVFELPYCEILEPHPPFVSEDNAVFRYERYDPVNLPDVRGAAVRVRVLDRSPQLDETAKDSAAESRPAVAAGARRAGGQPAPADAASPYATTFLDPAYNPVQMDDYQRQAARMIGLLQGKWGLTLFLVVTGTAFVWGAAHALMPGHAKTVVAAYLISQRGTYWHAAMLAIIVTVTHTALVVAMGLIIWVYQHTNPRLAPKLQLWLGLIAGLLVVGMGLRLAWLAVTGRTGHHHEHAHTHAHAHAIHAHAHADHEHTHSPSHDHPHADAHEHHRANAHTHSHPRVSAKRPGSGDALTFRTLLMLGIAGGIVPCPAATIIMFLGIGANVVGGALYAIAVFSLGLALMLMLVGSLALASRRYAAKVMSDAHQEHELSRHGRTVLLRIIPAFSGLAVTFLGGMITLHYVCLMRNVPSPFPWLG